MSSSGGIPSSTSASWRSGAHVGRYRVRKLLARGGMGEIYLVEHELGQGRRDHRVLKRLIGATQGIPEQAQMFLDEGRLAAMMRHPNIVTVHEVGSDGGTYFISMEYLHGVDARALLKEVLMGGGTVPIDQAVRLGIAACAGMHHAHELTGEGGTPLQIVHRDISPQNVFLTYEGEVKLLDFGVARSNRRDRDTTTRGLKGKVPYMSPEQCLSRPIDRRSDIFSLGIILFELTLGTRLFRGNSDYELMQQIVTGEVVPPSALNPGYPAALERIVLRTLQKPVDKRYQTALDLQHELESFAAAAGLDVSAAAMARFLRETFGLVPEAWKTDDTSERATRSGPVLVERRGQPQTVQMPFVTRPTPPGMGAAGDHEGASGKRREPGDRITRDPSAKAVREPSGPTGKASREPSGPSGRTVREPSGKASREPSGPSGRTVREPSGPSEKTAREPSGPSGQAVREPTPHPREPTPDPHDAAREPSGRSREVTRKAAVAPPPAVADRDVSGDAAPRRHRTPAGVHAVAAHQAASRQPAGARGPWSRTRLVAVGAAALCVLGLVALGLKLRGGDPEAARRGPPGAAPASRGAPVLASNLAVTELPDDKPYPDGSGVVLITAAPHRGIFKIDGRRVGVSCPLQIDQVDASREHVLEASLGADRPTVLQRFVVLPEETVILNVRFDDGGGKVTGSGFSTVSGPTGAIRVDAAPPCTVLVDGKRAGACPLKVRVPVGAHRVTIESDALGAPRSKEVRVSEGKVVVVSAAAR